MPMRWSIPSAWTADLDFPELAGVGVAFKLACALAGEGQHHAVLEQYADLVALGTVWADVMPLREKPRRCGGRIAPYGRDQQCGTFYAAAGVRTIRQKADRFGYQLYPCTTY